MKVGKYSEGIREINAFNLRNEQISKMKHGKDITAINTKKKKDIITLSHLANRYFEDKKSSNERRQKYNNHIKPLIGNKQIQNITKVDVKKVINKVLDLGRSNGTANSVLSLMSRMLANIYFKQNGFMLVKWQEDLLSKENTKRDEYIKALKMADNGDYKALIEIHKVTY